MKKVFTILLIQSIFLVHGFAQAPQTSIAGSVVDDKNKAVESATISLMKAEDSSVVKLSVTDKAGHFFDHSNGGSIYSSALGFKLWLVISRTQVFHRRMASSFPEGRNASAFS